jgi:hypothetical protein
MLYHACLYDMLVCMTRHANQKQGMVQDKNMAKRRQDNAQEVRQQDNKKTRDDRQQQANLQLERLRDKSH